MAIVPWSWAWFQKMFFLLVGKHSDLEVCGLMDSDLTRYLLQCFRCWEPLSCREVRFMLCFRCKHEEGRGRRSTVQLQQTIGQANPLLLWFWISHFSNIRSSVEPDPKGEADEGDRQNMKAEMSNTFISHQTSVDLSEESVLLEKAGFKSLQSNQGNCYQSPHIRGFISGRLVGS